MANYKKALVGSLDMVKLEGSPEVVIRRLRMLVQDARKQGYTNLNLKSDCDGDLRTGGSRGSLDLYGFKKEESE